LTITQQQAKCRIGELVDKYRALSEPQRQTITEAGVVHQFLDALFAALGWPVDDPRRYKYELSTHAGRPDMVLLPEQGGTLYVEAKRFGAIEELAQARKTITGIVTPGQLTLPGMASDRTREEQQAINYAFENGGTWAILTNFEKLRLFNARRDWLVLSFERPFAYLDEFDLLWQLSYERVCSGGLDALSNQRHREDVDSDYLAFISEWREILAEDLIARSAANPWAVDDDDHVRLENLRAVVQRVLDRLVVIRFAEDHLVVPAGTLYSLYELCRQNPYTFTLSEFFERLCRRFDHYHNSALFAPHLADQASFSNRALSGLVEKLYEARYRAMSADIMGNTYEQYLGKTLAQQDGHVVTVDNLETRKKQGSYYTPQVIVRYLVDHALGVYLYGTANGRPDGEPLPGERCKTSQEIQNLRVLDPACGSGSFLICAYQVLSEFYRAELDRLKAEREARLQTLIRKGTTIHMEIEIELAPWTAEIDRIQEYPRLILERHLYGVDLDPQAAEIATVNLIMRAMADAPRDRRLPLILNQNVKVGNSLIGAGPSDARYAQHTSALAEIRRLRLTLSTGNNAALDDPGHAAALQEIEMAAAPIRAALNDPLEEHFSDVDVHHPFHWAVEFPEAFVDEEEQFLDEEAGFDVVIGNPPWEIVKPDLREFYAQFDPRIESQMTRRQVEARIRALNAEDLKRAAAWEAQKARIEAVANYYGQSEDYTRQGRGDTATHKLFLERVYGLLRQAGRLAYVIPSGIYRDLGTKPLREMLLNDGHIQYMFSFSNERFFFPHVDHRFQFALLGVQKGAFAEGFWAAFRFNPRVAVAPAELGKFLADRANLVYVRHRSLERFSPDSLSMMEFQTQQDANVVEALYADHSLIGDNIEQTWCVRLNREFDMTNDRHLFNTTSGPIAVYNGRMIHQFDAYYAPHEFWIAEGQIPNLRSSTAQQAAHYRLGYRRIARATDSRTLIAAVIPPNTICDTVALVENAGSVANAVTLYLCAVFNSLCLDYVLRQKVAATVNMFYVYQLPLPRFAAGDPYFDAIVPRAARLTCTTSDFSSLWTDVMSNPWDETKGATDPAERQCLRDELDALVAHLYGLSREEYAHVLGTFPLVFPDDDAGRARMEVVLEVYDRFTRVTRGWPRE